MKFFIVALVLAIVGASNASLSCDVKPLCETTQPLMNGLDKGLCKFSSKLGSGLNCAGKGLNNIVGGGLADILKNGLSGLGYTVKDLPRALMGVCNGADHGNGLIEDLIRELLGGQCHRH